MKTYPRPHPFCTLRVLCMLLLALALVRGHALAADSGAPPLLPQGQWIPLPDDLTPEQAATAQRILDESEPRLLELHNSMILIMNELRSLSFAPDTHDDALGLLGNRLVDTRDALIQELDTLRTRLSDEVGFTPDWDFKRGCNDLRRP